MTEDFSLIVVTEGNASIGIVLPVPPINSVRRRNPDLSGWCPIAFVTRTRSCFTAFSRTFAVAPCDSLRSPRLVINWASFGAPAKPVAGAPKTPGFLCRSEFIGGTGQISAPNCSPRVNFGRLIAPAQPVALPTRRAALRHGFVRAAHQYDSQNQIACRSPTSDNNSSAS